ncbi:MAG: FtsQ-type POTRA domain-containing protein [Candidatus Pacebacteria bacterium]|nr:FtsQ-type POTRA domain-containing protein [Candidatus Paceibacterota bacterium]
MRNTRKNRKPIKQRYDFRKKKNRLVVNYKKILIIFFSLIFLYFLFLSNFFQVGNIEIKGNQGIKEDNIKKIVNNEIPELSKNYFYKNNIFLVSKKNIEEKLYLEFSEIENVKIKKIFPRTLKIEIIEKTPFIIWCRLGQCYYLDNNGVAFTAEATNYEDIDSKNFIKIIEQFEIEEEILGKQNGTTEESVKNIVKYIEDDNGKWEVKEDIKGREYYENEIGEGETNIIYLEQLNIDSEEKAIFEQININDQVSDKDFIDFALEINNEIQQINDLKIKFYKTKGTRTRQLIAYTDKNIRIYFNTISSAKIQAGYLKEILSKAISKNEINTIEYIYLESGNKIFYK